MGKINILIEGVTCSGKTTVCRKLNELGYDAVDGDKELAYQGNPETGIPTKGHSHQNHIWDLDKLNEKLNNKSKITFFCGGSRNFHRFIDRFDKVIVLDIDEDTLVKRLNNRKIGEWGNKQNEKDLVIKLNRTKEDIPRTKHVIDSTKNLQEVLDDILEICRIYPTQTTLQ